jgi:ATP-dependent Clp endopeptidase proteolytic subunit ClpP
VPPKTNAEKRERLNSRSLNLRLPISRSRPRSRSPNISGAGDSRRRPRLPADRRSLQPLSVKYAIDRVTEWFRDDPEAPIEIVINSGGGSVFAGLALFDYLQMIRGAGCAVTTTAVGMAASMAGILLQAGSTRVMSEHAYLMIHEASTSTWGKISELRDEVELIDKLEERMLAILAERSTMSAKQIKAKCARRDWWIDSREALKLGFVDEIR